MPKSLQKTLDNTESDLRFEEESIILHPAETIRANTIQAGILIRLSVDGEMWEFDGYRKFTLRRVKGV